MMRARTRWFVLLPCLAGAAWLVATADPAPASGALSLPTRATPSRTSSLPARVEAASVAKADAPMISPLIPRADLYPLLPPANHQPHGRDLFSARSWAPPAPALPAVTSQAAVPPPLPYTVLGKKQEGPHWEVFLGRGERTLLARTGVVLEGAYRVESIAPPHLVLTYLPLGQTQQLPIGEAW